MRTRRSNHVAPLALTLLAGLAAAAQPAHATILQWNNPAGGSAATIGNWTPAQLPIAGDILNYNLGATYAVTFPASVTTVMQQNFNQGTVSLSSTTPHTVTQQFVCGLAANSNSTVNITSGAFVVGNGTSGIVSVGGGTNSTGVLNLTSATSSLTVNGSGSLRIGNVANGTLNITIGALAQANGPANIQIGTLAGSQGTVSVSGLSGSVNSTLQAPSVTTGDLTVGVGGGGQLTASNSGRVLIGRTTSIAPNAGSSGTFSVGGGANAALFQTGADLHIAHNTTAAAAGTGTFTLQAAAPAAGSALVAGTTFVGDANGGTGTLNLAGGTFNTRTLVLDPVNAVFNHTGGTLQISSGGSFNPPTGVSLTVNGSNATNVPQVHFSGSTGSLTGGFVIGDTGFGMLKIDGGAVVTSNFIANINQRVGDRPGSSGTVTVSGPGSRLNYPSSTAMIIGDAGNGTLDISSSGVVSGGGITVSRNATATGVINVTGGSTLALTSLITIGQTAPATVNVLSSSNLTASTLQMHPESTLTINDSTMTFTGQVNLDGSVAISNGGEIDAFFVRIAGSVQGSGNVYGRVTILPGGSVTASGGDLFIGPVNNALNGFVNQGTLNVSDQPVRILDADGSPAGDITIDSGHLYAAGLTFSAGDSLTGNGGISAPITSSGAAFTVADGQLVFNGPVSTDETSTWTAVNATDQFVFAAGGDFTGRGSIEARVTSEEEASITANGSLSMGNDSTNEAILLNGPLHIGPHSVGLSSNTTAVLGIVTTIGGGTLSGPVDNSRTVTISSPFGDIFLFTVFDAVPILLPSFGIVEGHGTISHKLRTETNSSVNLTGPMSIRGSGFFSGSPTFPIPSGNQFVRWDGLANVGSHSLTFTTNDHRFDGPVSIAGGTIEASRLAIRGTLTGHGTLGSTSVSNPAIMNGGVMQPGGGAIGTFTLNGPFQNRFATSGSVLPLYALGAIEIDLSGDQGFAHDQIHVTSGDAQIFGTLTVRILDAEPPIGQVYTILRCDSGNVLGTFETVNLPTLATGGVLEVQYTESTVEVVVRPPCRTDFNSDGILSPDDLDEFITTYFSEPPDNQRADFNNDGLVSPDDLDEFITAYFEGC